MDRLKLLVKLFDQAITNVTISLTFRKRQACTFNGNLFDLLS